MFQVEKTSGPDELEAKIWLWTAAENEGQGGVALVALKQSDYCLVIPPRSSCVHRGGTATDMH